MSFLGRNMENTLVVDMDDIALADGPAANGMNWLYYLHGTYPDFVCNLFAIPERCPEWWLDMINRHHWLKLCMHGWNHDEQESIYKPMLKDWSSMGYSRVYKGPNWKVTPREMDLLADNGWVLAVKEKVDHPVKQWVLSDPRACHGHVWIESDWKRLEKRIRETPDPLFEFIEDIIERG